jgi:hypothetical protein
LLGVSRQGKSPKIFDPVTFWASASGLYSLYRNLPRRSPICFCRPGRWAVGGGPAVGPAARARPATCTPRLHQSTRPGCNWHISGRRFQKDPHPQPPHRTRPIATRCVLACWNAQCRASCMLVYRAAAPETTFDHLPLALVATERDFMETAKRESIRAPAKQTWGQ